MLWRFYKAHRPAMRSLLKHTVRGAVEVGTVDLAVQALDGTKLTANAARDQTYDATGLERLLARTEAAIENLGAERGRDPASITISVFGQPTDTDRDQVEAFLQAGAVRVSVLPSHCETEAEMGEQLERMAR